MDIIYLWIVISLVFSLIDSLVATFSGASLLTLLPLETMAIILMSTLLIAWLVFFILQGIGIYRMAANRGIKKKALAFVPFANIWYMGKIAGTCSFYGQKIKRAGLYTMLIEIVSTVISVLSILAYGYMLVKLNGTDVVVSGGGFDGVVVSFYNLSSYLLLILSVAYSFLMGILMMGVYKHYVPANYTMLGFLTLLCPPARYIIVFVLRKRKAIDYEAYVKARHEEYIRRQQQYYNQYGNPYGRPNGYGQNPYGQSYNGRPNPYGQSPYGQPSANEPPKPEEPFAEFASESQNTNTGSGETNGDSDGFFD